MENSKKTAMKVAVIVGFCLAAFLGASAWRYFTVVAPESEAEQAETTIEEEPAASPSSPESPAPPEEPRPDDAGGVSYSGNEASVWNVLKNFTWTTSAASSYLSFGSDGTVKEYAKESSTKDGDDFKIHAIEGDPYGYEGCLAIVSRGGDYATMRFLARQNADPSAFSDAPEADYSISSSLFGEEVFYKSPENEPATVYENDLPAELKRMQETIDSTVKDIVERELPAVSEIIWDNQATLSFKDGSRVGITTFTCNDDIGTILSVRCDLDSQTVDVAVSGAVSTSIAGEPENNENGGA